MTAQTQAPQSSKKRPANKPSAANSAPAKNMPRAARTTVLHLCPALNPGDPARETVDLAILTQRAGWRSLIASGGGLLVQESERAAVRHKRIPVGKAGLWTNWRNRARLQTLIQREKPVLIHAHGIEPFAHALPLAHKRNMPMVLDLTQPLADAPRIYRLLGHVEEIACVIRVPSDYMFAHLRETFHIPPEFIRIIPPGIDLNWFNAGTISPERLQTLSRLWRLPEQAAIVVVPMPLIPGNGHKPFLQALSKLKRDDVFAVLVGDDHQAPGTRAKIEALVHGLGLSGNVIMPEYCLDWPAGCWLANIIVAPNITPRGQNIELLAAQAIGRPIIAVDCGANAEMVLSGETAWLIPPNNVKALTETLQEAIRLKTAQHIDIAERTRDFIAQSFPQANWFNAMMDVYEALLAPAARRIKAKAA